MSYIKWNKTLTDYFFNENNKNKEVILYADKTLIEALGSQIIWGTMMILLRVF